MNQHPVRCTSREIDDCEIQKPASAHRAEVVAEIDQQVPERPRDAEGQQKVAKQLAALKLTGERIRHALITVSIGRRTE